MKKYFKIIILILLLYPANLLANTDAVFLYLDKESYFTDNIIFDVKLNEAYPVRLMGINLDFNPKYLHIATTSPNMSICELTVLETIDNTNGKYKIICGQTSTPTSTDFLLNISFQKQATGTTKIVLNNTFVSALDNPEDNIILREEVYNILLK